MQSRFSWLPHILDLIELILVPSERTERQQIADIFSTLHCLYVKANTVFRDRAYSIPITGRFVILLELDMLPPLSRACWKNKQIGIDFAWEGSVGGW